MKNNKMHRSFIRLFSVLLLSLFVNNLQAQTNLEHVWGYWDLDTVEITKQGVTEKHTLKSLLADKENLPKDMFTRLFLFDDQVGTNSTEEEFLSAEHLNQKGSFTVEDGKLLITMANEQARIFTYIRENDLLRIWYTREDTQFYLVYKLFKTEE